MSALVLAYGVSFLLQRVPLTLSFLVLQGAHLPASVTERRGARVISTTPDYDRW